MTSRIRVPLYSDLEALATKDQLEDDISEVQERIDLLVLSSNSGYVYPVTIPSSTWNVPNNLGRSPNVSFYVDGIGPILQEYDLVSGALVVTWPYPVSGYAVLT